MSLGERRTSGPEAVVAALRARGIDLRLDRDIATLTIDGRTLTRPWTWLGALPHTRHALLPVPSKTLLLTDRMPASLAEQARSDGAWYADTRGRAFVRAKGVLVHIDDARDPSKRGNPRWSRPGPTNLMSPARAQVVAVILTWPEMARAGVRQLARVSGVSVGLAQQALEALDADGFLTPNRALINADDLLTRWAAAFSLGLGRRLELGTFTGEPNAQPWADAGHTVYASGDAAAEGLHGPDLVLYVPELDTRAVVACRWRRPTGPNERANITVRQQFWTDPVALDFGVPSTPQVRTAPAALVYADLLAGGDPRQRETADLMREQIVGLRAR